VHPATVAIDAAFPAKPDREKRVASGLNLLAKGSLRRAIPYISVSYLIL
jgi:hypothetical protein